ECTQRADGECTSMHCALRTGRDGCSQSNGGRETVAGRTTASRDEWLVQCATLAARAGHQCQDSSVPQPTLFDERFVLEKQLGAGGMGIVHLALDLRIGRRVALKILNASGDTNVERFNREVWVLTQLAHPGIVKYLDH